MELLASLRDWLHELRHQRMRTLSTLMGVAWGTFGVVSILAFGEGLEDLMRERAQGLGQSLVVAHGQRTTRSFQGYAEGRPVWLTEADTQAIQARVSGLEAISPEYIRTQNLQRGDRIHNAAISGVVPAYAGLRSLRAQAGGRFLDDRDVLEYRRVVFLGHRLAANLFGDQDPVGGTLHLLGAPFLVVGVMQPKLQDNDYEGLDEGRACIPTTTFRQLFGDRYIDYFVYRARPGVSNREVTDQVYQVLGRRLTFDPADRDALNIWDTTESDRIRETAFLAMDLLITLACVLTLLVGGIGVGNLMFLVVRRRTHEIGIRMALGARPRWVLQEVLVQACLLVALGGAAGFLAAYGLSALIGASPLTDVLGVPRISLQTGLGTVLLLGAIALAAGWFPARRASRLDPVRAMAE